MKSFGDAEENASWVQDAERTLGHRFRNRALLRAALTHPSAGTDGSAFARLEFLGDAILALVVSLHLYHHHPDLSPGGLTRLRAGTVNRTILAQAATRLGLPPLLRLGKGEASSGGRRRPALLAAALEAVVAALFLDRGLRPVQRFLEGHLLPLLSPNAGLDPKSELQTLLQALFKTRPCYHLIHHWGPPHAPRFEVEVEVRGVRLGGGTGGGRREAEQAAARSAMAHLRRNHNILRSSVG
ncbi:MAG: ribonuclease III [Candidatus Methylomirabilales bacterium]